jgi:hypothetical protein
MNAKANINPLPHRVLATFSPTAGGLMGPPKKDDISREKMILMTSLRTHRAYAVSSQGLHYTYSPSPLAPLRGHCVHYRHHISARQTTFFSEGKRVYIETHLLCRNKFF